MKSPVIPFSKPQYIPLKSQYAAHTYSSFNLNTHEPQFFQIFMCKNSSNYKRLPLNLYQESQFHPKRRKKKPYNSVPMVSSAKVGQTSLRLRRNKTTFVKILTLPPKNKNKKCANDEIGYRSLQKALEKYLQVFIPFSKP